MSIIKQTAWSTTRFIAQNGGPVSWALYQFANLYRKSYNNLNYNMNENGEFYVLDRLSTTGVKTVLDVGANSGDYALACLRRFNSATVHSFEVAPPTYKKLLSRVSSDRVKLNDFGLSDRNGSFVLRYNPNSDGLSSLVEGERIHEGNWQEIQVNVMKGDNYCKENNIDQIDFLKIDVEGAEHLVLDGFSSCFQDEIISAVQFEFGMVNIYSKFLLKDFYDFFTKHGFVMGPLMPKGVNFREYNPRDEDFQGPPNFFAVHKSKRDIIEAVSR